MTYRGTKAKIGLLVAVLLPLVIAGCSVAQLQAGLELPSEQVVSDANRATENDTPPRPITRYDRFTVSVEGSVNVAVYTRESETATSNVLFIHGAGGGAWAWERYFERFPANYNLYALSWRGHFDSSPVRDADSSDYVADQAAVIDALRARNALPTHLVGHSYGGATSVLQVAETGSDIASLILIAPVVPLDYTLAQRLIVPTVAPWFINHENDPCGVYGGMFLSAHRMQNSHDRYAGKAYSVEKPGLIAKDGVSIEWQERLSTAVNRISDRNIPVSMLLARYDNVIVPRRQLATAQQLGINPIWIESGHYVPLDVEAEYSADIVSRLLSEARP